MSLQFLRPWTLAALLVLPWALWAGWIDRRLPKIRRRWSLALRALSLTLVVVAMARPQLVRTVDLRSAALILDRSDSVAATEQARAEVFAVAVAAASRPDRQLAVVSLAERAMVERSARDGALEPLRAVLSRGRTDLGAGLRLGVGVLPAESSRRLLLLSDGRHNQGALEPAVDLALAAGIPIDVLPLAAAVDPEEMLVEGLELPPASRVGQSFEVTARLRAQRAGRARLQIYRGGQALLDRTVDLAAGQTRLGVTVTVDRPGVERFKAVLHPQRDGWMENNEADGVSLVAGAPRLLLVTVDPARAAPVAAALRQGGRTVDILPPDSLPTTLLGLAGYQAVVIVDTPAYRVAPAAMLALQAAVRDLGKGLLMIGGEDGFGAGGWRNTPVERALPVEMAVRDTERRPGIALSFVIDQSGSMGQALDTMAAVTKLALAKEAVLQAAALLRSEDEVAVIAFDDSAHAIWPRGPLGEVRQLAAAVAAIPVGGGTNVQAGLDAALSDLEHSDAPLKHILLLTDGWSDSSGYAPLLRRLRDADITLSIVASGRDSAPFLSSLAAEGGGRHYLVEDAAQIPQIFVEETLSRMASYTVEEPFRPRPGAPRAILAGIDAAALPRLDGYNATTARSGATVALATQRDDPLLAHWTYGLGRAVAWTSDLKGQWAGAWMNWPPLGSFILRLVDWTLPPPDDEGLRPEIDLAGGRARLRLLVAGDAVAAGNLAVEVALADGDGEARLLPLRQVAAGRFEADAELPDQGAYVLRFTARAGEDAVGTVLAGLVVPYSPEYADPGLEPTDPRLLQLAERTGGRVLSRAEQVFDPVRGARAASEVWPLLLALAALIFPVDVAVRRLGFGVWNRPIWLRGLLRDRQRPIASILVEAPKAELRSASPSPMLEPKPPAVDGDAADVRRDADGGGIEDASAIEGTMARLRAAKRRARRG